jgi:hypothetical protein
MTNEDNNAADGKTTSPGGARVLSCTPKPVECNVTLLTVPAHERGSSNRCPVGEALLQQRLRSAVMNINGKMIFELK